MTIVPLTTYLKMYRKRTGFTHDEVAFLLGSMCGTSVSRHEQAKRLPVLKTALMYEAIFGATIREIYEGVFVEVQGSVRRRARGLCTSLQRRKKTPSLERKIALLKAIIGEEASASKN
jgi:DNA-binding XRE family transcriptional regulator